LQAKSSATATAVCRPAAPRESKWPDVGHNALPRVGPQRRVRIRRIVMRHSLASAWFTAVLLATPVVSIDATAQAHNRHCSDASVIGRCGFTTEGTILGVGDVAAVGIVAFDSQGIVSGKQTRSLSGQVADETFSGTYTMNADCTGTETIDVFQTGVKVRTAALSFVILNNGGEARALFRSLVLPNGVSLLNVITIEAKRLFPKSKAED